MNTAQREAAAKRVLDAMGIDASVLKMENALGLHADMQTKEERAAVRIAVCSHMTSAGMTYDDAKQEVALAASAIIHKPAKVVRDTTAAFVMAFHHKLLA